MAAGEPGLTHWSRFDVAGMWSLIRGVSTDDAFRQAGAWQSTYEAAQSLAGRLRWYRDGLAGKWSPDGSEAAAAYLGRLDELIGSAQQLADVAVSNRQALVTLANAVDEARPKMQRVYEESQAMRQVGAQPRAGAALALRQQQLQNQATQIMESLGSAALDSWRHYATADDYQPPQPVGKRSEVEPVFETPSPKVVNPIEPTAYRAENVEHYQYDSTASVGSTSKNSLPSMLAGSRDSTPGIASQRSQFLMRGASGRNATAVVSKPSDDWLVGTGSEWATAPVQVLPDGATERVAIAPSGATMSGVRRSLSPNGVIGEAMPTIDNGRPVMPRSLANPTGGVIGGQEAGMGVMGGGGRGVDRRSERRRRREYDPDEPWIVPQGLPAVLNPDPEPTYFDPGPGVIGLDR